MVERLFFAERRLRQHLVFEPAKRLGVFDVKAYMHNGVFQSQCLVRVRLAHLEFGNRRLQFTSRDGCSGIPVNALAGYQKYSRLVKAG